MTTTKRKADLHPRDEQPPAVRWEDPPPYVAPPGELRALLQRCIDEWPEFDTQDEEADACDLVTWFGNWREEVAKALGCRPLTDYEARVRVLEWREGMTTSDAQGYLDAQERISKPSAREKPTCPTCHGDDLVTDANAEWDIEAQRWTLRATFDDCFCCTCEKDITPEWTEVPK